jgi:hypothetical protein
MARIACFLRCIPQVLNGGWIDVVSVMIKMAASEVDGIEDISVLITSMLLNEFFLNEVDWYSK